MGEFEVENHLKMVGLPDHLMGGRTWLENPRSFSTVIYELAGSPIAKGSMVRSKRVTHLDRTDSYTLMPHHPNSYSEKHNRKVKRQSLRPLRT